MSNTTQPTDAEKKKAFEMKAELSVYQLYQIAEIINLASTRGSFKGSELSHVGTIFDNLTVGIDKAFKIAREVIESESSKIEKQSEQSEQS